MMGTRPFADDTPQAVFENILKGKIEWPEIGDGEDGISQNALDFLSILMHPNPRWRLGANGLSEIKKHPFFSDFNWNNWHHHKPYFVPSNRHIP